MGILQIAEAIHTQQTTELLPKVGPVDRFHIWQIGRLSAALPGGYQMAEGIEMSVEHAASGSVVEIDDTRRHFGCDLTEQTKINVIRSELDGRLEGVIASIRDHSDEGVDSLRKLDTLKGEATPGIELTSLIRTLRFAKRIAQA